MYVAPKNKKRVDIRVVEEKLRECADRAAFYTA